MDDLIDRLRPPLAAPDDATIPVMAGTLREAAEEIERLRRMNRAKDEHIEAQRREFLRLGWSDADIERRERNLNTEKEGILAANAILTEENESLRNAVARLQAELRQARRHTEEPGFWFG
jgi:multidrug resistance efflux pump